MQVAIKLLSALALCAVTAFGAASPADPKSGVEYLTLAQPQDTENGKQGKQIEVTEFFAYYCPHCRSYEPALSSWVSQQGANIKFRRVHVAPNPNVRPQQRLFYTLEAMGLTGQYHNKVFAAMHDEGLRLAIDEQVFQWAAAAGIERASFVETYRSFGVQARVKRADALMAAYHVDYWPVLAVDGRFMTSPFQAGSASKDASEEQEQQMSLQVLSHLVAKAKADRK